ncbi:MAG: hypothetical protein ACKODM_16825 [Cytophagales bacterium]
MPEEVFDGGSRLQVLFDLELDIVNLMFCVLPRLPMSDYFNVNLHNCLMGESYEKE